MSMRIKRIALYSLLAFVLSSTGCSGAESVPVLSCYDVTWMTEAVKTSVTEIKGQIKIKKIPEKEELVCVKDYISDIMVELRYATQNNFTGEVIYDFNDAYLRYGTIEKLLQVQQEIRENGYVLKIWDAYRPVYAQFDLWEICPNSIYVANPNKGYSSHSKGNTVDLTIVNKDGTEIPMPTGFDDFSAKADRDYSDCLEEEAQNAGLLEETMMKYGFEPYFGEWWHYEDTDAYPVEMDYIPES